MNLVDDDELDKIRVQAVARLSSDDVPLFRRRDDDLSFIDLRLGQADISRQLADLYQQT